jgi:hypothetical protein
METLKFNMIYILTLFLSLLMTSSCEKESETKEAPLSRLFRPTKLTAGVIANQVTFNWTAVGEGIYSLEMSKDSLRFTNELQVFTIKGISSYTVQNLWSQTMYSARIKTVSSDPSTEESGWQEITFKTETENIFNEVAIEDIGINSVLLRWDMGKDVTHIVVSAEGKNDINVTLSKSDSATGKKLISGLSAGAKYTFKIYLDKMLRGTISVTTKTS